MVMVLAGLVALPLNVSAQAESEDSLSSWQVEAKPTPEEPALQLKLDEAGVAVVPGYPPRFDELELRVKRAKIGFGVTVGVAGASMVVLTIALGASLSSDAPASWTDPAIFASFGVALAAGLAMYATLGTWIHRKRKLRKLKRELWESQYTHHETPRRVQWDLERSRLVF